MSILLTGAGALNSIGPYTSAFVAVVVSRGGLVTAAEQGYLTTFENAIGPDILENDRIHICLSDSIAFRTSFINPSSTMISPVNSPTFAANRGYTGNATTSYLNTNYNPNTQGVKYTLNNFSIGIYSRTNIQVIGSDIGSGNGTQFNLIQARRETNQFNGVCNDGTFLSAANTDSKGFFLVNGASGIKKIYKNGITQNSIALVASAIPSLNLFICGFNNNGTPVLASTRQYSFYCVGSGNMNQLNFYNAVQALGTSIGWAV